ncbi:MAG: wax ester/triacylglycerol synthase family O-acyltransferase [Acidobacteriota bacterium]|nr:wax ester/triacylglycerol synthase family O-acyltransferase [Acidobacteriota bacterium]
MEKHESLSNTDTAWWRMEDPTNLMMVTGVLGFEKPVTRGMLIDVLENRLITFNRFRQKVSDPTPTLKHPVWVDVPELDLDYHLVEETLPGDTGYEAFRQRVSELMSRPLDYERPLWQVHLISNIGTEGNAVVMRTHHCIADGMALIAVMFAMTSETAEASLIHESPEPKRFSSTGNIFSVAGKGIAKIWGTVKSPTKMFDLARLGGASAITTGRLLIKKPDPVTRFKGPLSVTKVPAWSRPVPLEDVKAIKNVFKGTVNDVLLTAMTGGLRRYMVSKGDDVTGLKFRAAVPVNLRPPGQSQDLGNHFGLVFLSLPVGIEDPLERMVTLKRRMDRLKNSPEAIVALGILRAIGMTPIEIQRVVVEIFGAKSTAVMTNVPGPRQPLYLAGQKIDNIMFWVPQSGRVGLGVSIFSYNGQVRLGVATDADLVPDPQNIIEGFYEEMEDLMDLVRQVQE